MGPVIVQNTLEGEEPPAPPLRDDGTSYRLCMYFDGSRGIAFADTYGELIDVLVPGYASMDEEHQDVERIKFALRLSGQLQAEIMYGLEVTKDTVTEDEWNTLVANRVTSPPRADWWACEIPLVVVETSYEPYTDVPRPASAIAEGVQNPPNLLWLRPSEEEDFLFSLESAGQIVLLESSL